MSVIVTRPYQNLDTNMLSRLTAAGTVVIGSGVTTTQNSKTGQTAFDFVGNNTGKITVGPGIPQDFAFDNNSSYTIELWIKPRNTSVAIICGNLLDSLGTGHYWVTLNNTYQGFATVALGNPNVTSKFGSTSVELNVWSHIALSCSNGVLKCFVNGIKTGSDLSNGTYGINKTNLFTIGASTDGKYCFNGIIDDFRITKGVAKYSQNFTPV